MFMTFLLWMIFFEFLLYHKVLKSDRILFISLMYHAFRDRGNSRGYSAYEQRPQYARTHWN